MAVLRVLGLVGLGLLAGCQRDRSNPYDAVGLGAMSVSASLLLDDSPAVDTVHSYNPWDPEHKNNGNGIVENGEHVLMGLTVSNAGAKPVRGLTASIKETSSGENLNGPWGGGSDRAVGDIPAGGTVRLAPGPEWVINFRPGFALSKATTLGYRVTFTDAAERTSTADFTVQAR